MANPVFAMITGWDGLPFTGDATNLRGNPAQGLIASVLVRPVWDGTTPGTPTTLCGHWDPAGTLGWRFFGENTATGCRLGFESFDATNALVTNLWDISNQACFGKLFWLTARVGVFDADQRFYLNGTLVDTQAYANNFAPAAGGTPFSVGADAAGTNPVSLLWGIGGLGFRNAAPDSAVNDQGTIAGWLWEQTQRAYDIAPVLGRGGTGLPIPAGTSYFDQLYSVRRGAPRIPLGGDSTAPQTWVPSLGSATLTTAGTHATSFISDSAAPVWGEIGAPVGGG